MFLTDPIADMLTRVRNANAVMHEKTDVPHTNIKERIAEILKEEGYISNYKIVTDGNKKSIRIYLKYDGKERVIKGIKRISKPGRRVYKPASEIKNFKNGYGTIILSTNKGIIANDEAYAAKVGGEVLCTVW